MGPYRIIKELEPQTTFALDLLAELKSRDVHNAFHASLLRIHVPNDDRKFPGRQLDQVSATSMGANTKEWQVDRIISHSGAGKEAQFQLKWKSGDVT
ncbi:hypothetical protein M422DRAFT_181234, partial [Sphaerobolus stellatus SS14]